MTLADYLKTFNRKELAKELNVTSNFITQIINGYRKFPIKHIKKLQSLTNGQIPKHILRPDIFDPPTENNL